ncbi:type II toxin-antitoxin system HicB family antitoxin [Companilactobacillus ginsenosidimutans]|uniref:HicB-like antitoxin of toxin-antitoxin system domain-containing protein n=1 Tax=Companilactobacillus ginsenosidimutans TaxID=1007676 RepID=A0A0H4R3G2_9LACO|nr:type II toxin-antitoxin system HicB family antitoxin [Companilactobacillus ginsenosidimutans]AKP68315.1 hypothetical protein ABM34_12710 [Companilactobacillus ginsenosidimutans]
MRVSYPAMFFFIPNETIPYYIHFPDFNTSGTQGRDVNDALYMAEDWLGIQVADDIENGNESPSPSFINSLSLNNPKGLVDDPPKYNADKSFISMVSVELDDYLDSKSVIKKTLTIPSWANELGHKYQINFSKTLTDSIAKLAVNQKGFEDFN